jgi:hypothetical protein
MFAGKYQYSIKRKIGKKVGALELNFDEATQSVTGAIQLKGMMMPIRGKVDGHKIEFYGSHVGKLSTYIFCVGAYTNDDGATFSGKMEDKRSNRVFDAVRVSETVAE